MLHVIQEEVAYIDKQIDKHFDGTFKWERPISHIVDREPDAKIRQDACTSWGMGGYSAALHYWWQLDWAQISPKLPDKFKNKEISINVGELAAIVMNFVAAVVTILEKRIVTSHQPRVLCSEDNTTSSRWYY